MVLIIIILLLRLFRPRRGFFGPMCHRRPPRPSIVGMFGKPHGHGPHGPHGPSGFGPRHF